VIALATTSSGSLSRVLNTTLTPVTHLCLPFPAAPGQLSVREIHQARALIGLLPTRDLYLFGSNIAKSPSPAMHNAAFAELGFPHQYRLAECNTIEEVLCLLSDRERCLGGNMTMPHKLSIIPHLDVVGPHAMRIGAVNTVRWIDGKLHGWNTDWLGIARPIEKRLLAQGRRYPVGALLLSRTLELFRTLLIFFFSISFVWWFVVPFFCILLHSFAAILCFSLLVCTSSMCHFSCFTPTSVSLLFTHTHTHTSLSLANFSQKTKLNVLVLGAGGTARAALYAVEQLGAQSHVYNRTASKASALAAEFPHCEALTELSSVQTPAFDVVISTLPPAAHTDELVQKLGAVLGAMHAEGRRAIVLDVVYYPRPTKLSVVAAAAQCECIDGLEMLVEQGVWGFEYWSGVRAPASVMKAAAGEHAARYSSSDHRSEDGQES
jgi:shikimate 5-dehydrogenase